MPADALPEAGQIDGLLRPLLQPPPASQEFLGALLEDEARPIIRAVVRRELTGRGRTDLPREDAEDVEGAVLAQVLTRLRDLASGFDSSPIRDFRAYVAVAAFHGCHALLRQRHPERTRLTNRLRYLMSHDRRFAMWESTSAQRLCGLKAWDGRDAAPSVSTRVADAVSSFSGSRLGEAVPEVAAALAVFKTAGGPVELGDLTSAVAEMLNIRDVPSGGAGVEAKASRIEWLADPAPSAETELVDRESVRRLWEEVCQLPVRQRVALLLNLRDPQGGGALTLLPSTGVAGIRAIAATLEMPAPELAAIWPTLPLDDVRIAERLGVTRQQVINLRKAARDRLARRMRGREGSAVGAGNMARG